MNREFNLLKNLGTAAMVIFIAWVVGDFPALTETVEVSGGGQCEGDITADNLNGQVVCTYGNGDTYQGQFVDGNKISR